MWTAAHPYFLLKSCGMKDISVSDGSKLREMSTCTCYTSDSLRQQCERSWCSCGVPTNWSTRPTLGPLGFEEGRTQCGLWRMFGLIFLRATVVATVAIATTGWSSTQRSRRKQTSSLHLESMNQWSERLSGCSLRRWRHPVEHHGQRESSSQESAHHAICLR